MTARASEIVVKIRISRRRLKTFVAKWGGLVIIAALVLPIAIVGVAYIHASSRVDGVPGLISQYVTITNLEAVEQTPDTVSSVTYRLTISVMNDTTTTAQVKITDARLALDDLTFDLAGSDAWQGRVAGKNIHDFYGYIVIGPDAAQELDNKLLTLKITGFITVSAKYAFVSNEETRPFNITTEASIPRPTTVAPTEQPPE